MNSYCIHARKVSLVFSLCASTLHIKESAATIVHSFKRQAVIMSGGRFGTGFTGGINTFWSCNKAGAIPHFTDHIKSNPRHFDSWLFRGISHSIIGEHGKAVHDFQNAESVGSPSEKLIAKAKLLSLQGKRMQSRDVYNEAHQKYPSDGIGWFWAAMTFPELQDSSKWFMRAIELNYMPYECHYQLGRQCLESDNPLEDKQSQYDAKCTKAISEFNACLQGNPYRTVCHIELGFANLQLNHIQDAKKCFERAVELNPVLTDSNAGVAMLYGHIFLVYLRMRGCLAVQPYACAGKCI